MGIVTNAAMSNPTVHIVDTRLKKTRQKWNAGHPMSKGPDDLDPVFRDIFDGMFKTQRVIATAVQKEVQEAEDQALADENANKKFEKEIA